MALKFLNKKGWHTGSLKNVENVWKAEQKHEAEQRKLEELRKQIQDEREKSEFRLLQEQAGLVPRQERLDFLYESGLGCGKASSEGFKALEEPTPPAPSEANASSSKSAVPGALFEEDKPQSANDSWRKLHTDPLLQIRQREQEALARIKNNPIKMAMIKKSVEAEKKQKEEKKDKKKKKKHKKHHDSDGDEDDRRNRENRKSKHRKHSSKPSSDSDEDSRERKRDNEYRERKSSKPSMHSDGETTERRRDNEYREKKSTKPSIDSDGETRERRRDNEYRERKSSKPSIDSDGETRERRDNEYRERKSSKPSIDSDGETRERRRDHEFRERHSSKRSLDSDGDTGERRRNNEYRERKSTKPSIDSDGETRERRRDHNSRKYSDSRSAEKDEREKRPRQDHDYSKERGRGLERENRAVNHKRGVHKMTEEERAERLRQMQVDAELHEEQRWKRLKKAEENDKKEEVNDRFSRGKNFLDEAQKSIFGAEKGGSSTIEESVRRRAYFSQGSNSAHESNAFRR